MRSSTVAGVLAGAALAVPALVPEIGGRDRRWPGAALVAARRPLAIGLGVVAGSAAALVPWLRGPGAGAVVASGAVLGRSVWRDRRHRARRDTASHGPDLAILVANVWKGRADPLALAGILRVQRPDLVVLPEAGPRFTERLLEGDGLADLGYRACSAAPLESHRHRYPDPDGPWTTVLLAPTLGDAVAEPARPGGLFGWVEVHGGALGPVRVLAAHPAAPVQGLVGRWSEELDRIATWREAHRAEGAWTVVAGDLNTTREHAVLARLGGRCVGDRGERAATWPSRWGWRVGFTIDHVLVSDPVTVRETRVLTLPGSDHRAVLARLALPTGSARRDRWSISPRPRPDPRTAGGPGEDAT